MENKKFKTISVKELVKKILNHEHLFIVDARDTDAFDDWKVEGKNVEVINVPYSEVKQKSIDSYLDKLPKNEDIYVICAKGGSSQKVAQQIVEAGYNNVFSVEGGMNAWSEHLEPIKIGNLESGGRSFNSFG